VRLVSRWIRWTRSCVRRKGSAMDTQAPELLRRLLRAKDRMDAAPQEEWSVQRLARVSGVPAPSWADDEKTFEEIKARLQKGLDFAKAITPAQLDGLEDKLIPLKIRGEDVQVPALTYLNTNAMPNFYFHVTTAFGLLRHNGIEIGKRDFMGNS